MALVNTNRSAIFIKSGANLPVPPDNFLETAEPVMVVPEYSKIEAKRLAGKLNSKLETIDLCRTSVNFNVSHIARAQGATYDKPPEYGELLKIGGFNEEIVTDNNVIYTNATDRYTRGSVLAFMDGQKYSMSDAVTADIEIVMNVGEPMLINGTLTGYINNSVPTPEEPTVPDLSQEDVIIVSCVDIITVNGTIFPAQSVKISMNPEMVDLYTMGGDSGKKAGFVTDYALELEVSYLIDSTNLGREPEAIEGDVIQSIEAKIGLDTDGNVVDGKTVTLTANLGKVTSYTDTDQDGMLLRTTTYRLFNDPSDNYRAITIKHGVQA